MYDSSITALAEEWWGDQRTARIVAETRIEAALAILADYGEFMIGGEIIDLVIHALTGDGSTYAPGRYE